MNPGGPPSRTVTIQLSRDTLILIAALAFLGIAILLAIVFPGQSPGASANETSSPETRTNVAGTSSTSRPTIGVATLATSSSANDASTAAPSNSGEAYPNPANPESTTGSVTVPTEFGGGLSENGSPTPAGPAIAQFDTTPIPTFQPNRSPQAGTASANSAATQATAYPAPPSTTLPDEDFTDVPDQATPQPTDDLFQPAPTTRPVVTARPVATTRPVATAPAIQATTAPAGGSDSPQRPPTAVPAPTTPPIDVLRGSVRWTVAQSPIFVRRDLQIVPGATLVIEPGVEVRVAPGASLFVEGTMYALGKPGQKVVFTDAGGGRWEGIYGRQGSDIALEHTDIRGGGNGGTVLLSEGGNLAVRGGHITENGGHIQVTNSRLEMRDSEIAGNDMPYGSALEANYTGGNFVTLTNNRIGGNRLQPGTSPVRISSQSPFDILNLDVQGNLLVGTEGPDLTLSTNGPLAGGLTCNALLGGPDGLSIRTETNQVPGFELNVRDNAIEAHTPPIIPIYLEYGIGRGATSEVALDMRNNWWGNAAGPYEPDRHADGRGDAVGDTIEFAPWLTARPACAPRQ